MSKEYIHKHPKYNFWCNALGQETDSKGVARIRVQKNRYLKTSMVNHETGKLEDLQIHRLVFETLVGPIPKGMCINHKDLNRHNNQIDNLELVTYQENKLHAVANGRPGGASGELHHGAKLTEKQVLEIYKLIKDLRSDTYISNIFGLNVKHVNLLRLGKRWTKIFKQHFDNPIPSPKQEKK